MDTFKKNMLEVVKEKGKVVAFTISRQFWGNDQYGGTLLNEHTNLMCCLGFYSLACGASKSRIMGKQLATEVLDKDKIHWLTEPSCMQISNETLLAVINDKDYFTTTQKERKITEIFADNGITVTFVG